MNRPPSPGRAGPPTLDPPLPQGLPQLLLLLVPFGATAVVLLLLRSLLPAGHFSQLLAAAAVQFTLAGKLIVLGPAFVPSGLRLHFTPVELALLVVYMDAAFAFLFCFSFDLLRRLRGLGARLQALDASGREQLRRRPWLGRLTSAGVLLFVAFPITGTGAIAASVLGRLLGLPAIRTWCAIVAGSVLGTAPLVLFSEALGRLFLPVRDQLWFQAAGIGLVALLFAGLVLRLFRLAAARTRDPA